VLNRTCNPIEEFDSTPPLYVHPSASQASVIAVSIAAAFAALPV
jgi:hypothetical protein